MNVVPRWRRILGHVVLVALSFVFVMPLAWMVMVPSGRVSPFKRTSPPI